jgi:hypothetical protein
VSAVWSWVLAASGATALLTAGRWPRAGWLVGIASQALWAAYAVATRQPGFLAQAGVFAIAYGRLARQAWQPPRPAGRARRQLEPSR